MASLRHGRLLLTPPCANASLDKSMLAAFAGALCTAAAYILAFSIHECLLRHQRQRQRRRQEQQESSAEEEQRREGCTELRVDIPVATYGSCSSGAAREGETSCSVCLADYEEGKDVRVLPRCGHMFHKECIDLWVATPSPSCPVCRGRVIERPAEAEAAGCGGLGVAEQ